MKICHLSSAHPRYDARIFLKECCSLARAGHDVTLVVADGRGNDTKGGVSILDIGLGKGRIDRMRNVTRRVLGRALAEDANVYHIHDPELLPAGARLKKQGKHVVFDAHEDVPLQILGKHYLGPFSRRIVSGAFSTYERNVCRRFDAIVAATPTIRDKFLVINPMTIDVRNFPMLGELISDVPVEWSQRNRQVCYLGGIASIRGIRELVRAMERTYPGIRLEIGGRFVEKDVEDEVKTYPGWRSVDERGFLGREEVRDVLARSMAGLVTLHPIINYLDALPVKMFEYMSAGLPVIASNFPLWNEIVERADCGICVDPLDSAAIAKAINWIVDNPDRASEMGMNGKTAVKNEYNWSIEEEKLLDLYSRLKLKV